MARRGAFIVLEGLDRSGKSTQVERLVAALQARGHSAKAVRFPDRTTAIGSTIDAYLSRKSELDDRAIHLLFAANRWERVAGLMADLSAGVCIVSDRYAFSGAAFSVAKGLDYEWCKAPDAGLPAPDLVLFLDVDAQTAAQRGGYGDERYEEPELQKRVRTTFKRLATDPAAPHWTTIDASKGMDDVTADILSHALYTVDSLSTSPPALLWQ